MDTRKIDTLRLCVCACVREHIDAVDETRALSFTRLAHALELARARKFPSIIINHIRTLQHSTHMHTHTHAHKQRRARLLNVVGDGDGDGVSVVLLFLFCVRVNARACVRICAHDLAVASAAAAAATATTAVSAQFPGGRENRLDTKLCFMMDLHISKLKLFDCKQLSWLSFLSIQTGCLDLIDTQNSE